MQTLSQRGGKAQQRGWALAWRFVAMAHADVAVVLQKANTNQVGGR